MGTFGALGCFGPSVFGRPLIHTQLSIIWDFLDAYMAEVPLKRVASLHFLVTIKGLTIPWSLTLAMVDAFSVFLKRPSRQLLIVSIICIGDWVLSFLSLAAACSTASVADFMVTEAGAFFCGRKLCSRYQLSAAMAFLSWCLSITSALFNLWILPSLYNL
uniref:CASP-like protein 5C3 isoform X1 n=1 Tax=Erigeron canadensis TaxID=72917 RepID=UPI001CB96BB9|nr:CASP-like protein 5C3 isoform X1 [Erigeron canadensis]